MAALNPLPRWQRRCIYSSMLALVLTGLAWLAVHYSIGAGAGELPHPAEAWLIRVHGAAAMAGLFFFGSLVATHAPRGWRMQRQRKTGLGLWGLLGLLVVTGYLLYYFAPEALRPAIGLAHAAAGTVLGAGVLWHRRGSQRGLPHKAQTPHALQAHRARRHHVERH